MRKFLIPFTVLLILPLNLLATPPKLEVPTTIKPVNGYVRLTPATDAQNLLYLSLDGLVPFPSEELKDPKRLLIPTQGVAPGTYRFKVVASSKEGDLSTADFVVVIDGPPAPVDPLVSNVQNAFNKETAPDKAKLVANLASLYRVAASNTVLDPTVKTYADLFTDLKAASVTLLPADAIPLVRKAVGERLNKSFGNPTAPIDRTFAASELNAIVQALEGAK